MMERILSAYVNLDTAEPVVKYPHVCTLLTLWNRLTINHLLIFETIIFNFNSDQFEYIIKTLKIHL